MIATERHCKGLSPPDVVPLAANSSTETAVVSPSDFMLGMNGLWTPLRQGMSTSSLLSPSATRSLPHSSPSMATTTASFSSPYADAATAATIPPLASARDATCTVAAMSSSTNTNALFDQYSRWIRSRDTARSDWDLKHRTRVIAALKERRTATSSYFKARPLKTKYSIPCHRGQAETATVSRGMKRIVPLGSPAGLQPLRAPPALPRVTPGQQLVGIKASCKEVTQKE
jgi:hypothetical protein